MAGITRIGDRTKGHSGHGPRLVFKGSKNVIVNSRPAARMGDKVVPTTVHPGIIIKGNPRVLVNNKPVARKGDRIVCGEKIAKGSRNVKA